MVYGAMYQSRIGKYDYWFNAEQINRRGQKKKEKKKTEKKNRDRKKKGERKIKKI